MDLTLAIAGAHMLPRYKQDAGPWDWESRYIWPDDMGIETVLRKAIVRSAIGIGSAVRWTVRMIVKPARRAAQA